MSRRLTTALASLVIALSQSGCSNPQVEAVKMEGSFRTLGQAEESFKAKKYSEALATYDEVIKSGVVQADVLADAYLKRACCKIETGDLAGATDDLAKAEQGGAVGDEYQAAKKKLSEKK